MSSLRKKHNRRTAHEIDKNFSCPYHGCHKYFGSEGSQNLHIKIKHNGGTKTEREKLAQMLITAYIETINCEQVQNTDDILLDQHIIDKIDLNLPPGILTRTA